MKNKTEEEKRLERRLELIQASYENLQKKYNGLVSALDTVLAHTFVGVRVGELEELIQETHDEDKKCCLHGSGVC